MDVVVPGIYSFGWDTFLRILCAAIFGGVIGIERELRGKPAGLKTFSLVCVGAALATIMNQYMYYYVVKTTGDIARLPAQVISGIGFLGAGTIMVSGKNRIKGLTTAAALWVTASLGIAWGSGYWAGGFIGTIIVLLSSLGFQKLDHFIANKSRYMKICIELTSEAHVGTLYTFLKEKEIDISSLRRAAEYCWYERDVCLVVELDLKMKCTHEKLLKDLETMDGVRFLQEVGHSG